MSSYISVALLLVILGVSALHTDALFNGTGYATTYWDCCKVSCGWTSNSNTQVPVQACEKDGVTPAASNAQGACQGGTAYKCNDDQPWIVSDTLAYGFAAANLTGGTSGFCCVCVEVTFTNYIVGKKMIVQLTNSGDDEHYNQQIDIAIPGGGVGIFNACTDQWGAPADGWGLRYGGVQSEAACNDLPAALQAGCKFRFEWFSGTNNPNLTYVEVPCPSEITAKSKCSKDSCSLH